MNTVKKLSRFLLNFGLTLIIALLGINSGVFMAAAGDLPDAGKTEGGEGNENPKGISTVTAGQALGDEEFYSKDIDERITKIRPMATPIDQISRYAKAQHSDSFEVKYYSVGTRPIKCTTNGAVTYQAEGQQASFTLPVDDPNMFTLDDTIRVVGIPGETGADGAYQGKVKPDLVLCVCGRAESTNAPIVYCVNGKVADTMGGQPIWVPQNGSKNGIPSGTTLIRMGKACGELDAQTGRFNNIPKAEIQYCQNFMIQVEQSTFDKLAKKEVNWDFSDIEEDGIYDMRLAQENTFLFGVKQKIQHVTKDGMTQWFTGGIWHMAGKDIEIGHWDTNAKSAVVSDDDLVNISKDLFVGTGIGNKRKIMLCGSEVLAALSKIKSEKFRLKDSVEIWNLKFKSWDTDFGEILTMHHELLDANGMANYAFALDPEFLTKKTHVSWTRNILDLKNAGVRNTHAVVIQEVSCLYLRNPKAHARMKLATAA